MWTVTVIDHVQRGDLWESRIRLQEDANPPFVQCFQHDGSPRGLRSAVMAYLTRKDGQKVAPLPAPGTTVNIDPDPAPTPTQPTADEQLAIDFAAAWRNVLVLEEADARQWGTAAQRTAVTNQLATARGTTASLYQQKPAVCIPIMVRP